MTTQTHTAENDAFTTSVTEWVVRSLMQDGGVHTGDPKTSHKAAQESGERLERINGAEWWLEIRTRIVTVETSPWARVTPPGCPDCGHPPDTHNHECDDPDCGCDRSRDEFPPTRVISPGSVA